MQIRIGAIAGVVMFGVIGSPASAQVPPSPRDTLAALPRSVHNSEIRIDAVPGRGGWRVWINANEDDLRLYSPAGAQLDADIQVSTELTPGASALTITLLVETRGSITPAPGPQALTLVADGRSVTMTRRELPPARSGDLLFLSVEALVPMTSLVQLATARTVDGRVWGVPFRLHDAQIELLRAFAWQLIAESDWPR